MGIDTTTFYITFSSFCYVLLSVHVDRNIYFQTSLQGFLTFDLQRKSLIVDYTECQSYILNEVMSKLLDPLILVGKEKVTNFLLKFKI